MINPKVLFILKRRHDYNEIKHSYTGLSTGLFNSANFMNQMLLDSGIQSDIYVAVDNNDIDREVTKFRPTHVIIEAIWVVPEKFYVLTKLHPNVKWIIRLHSETPFLANDGMAFDWIGEYANFKNVHVAVNAPRILGEMRTFLKIKNGLTNDDVNEKVIYLPNYYPQEYKTKELNNDSDVINISCFGAIRPLKNHMTQALASIKFAEKIGKKLRFHINSERVEMKGDSVLNNLKGLFQHLYKKDHQMICHGWHPREEFLTICEQMDIGLQCSFSETFNIVGADLVSQGVPLVGSTEIPWAPKRYCASPVDSEDIYDKLLLTYITLTDNVSMHQKELTEYTNKTKEIWVEYLKKNKKK